MANDSQPAGTPGKKLSVASVLVPVAGILAVTLLALGYLRGRENEHPAGDGHSHDGAIRRKVGEKIPDLTLRTLDGQSVKLSEIKGKVILLNFWATWCPPCVLEMPSLQKLSTEYGPKGLAVVGLNLDENPEEVLAPFLKKHSIDFQTFVDPKGEVADRFTISGLPLTIVVDAKQTLLLEQLGDEDWFAPAFRAQFEKWLKEVDAG